MSRLQAANVTDCEGGTWPASVAVLMVLLTLSYGCQRGASTSGLTPSEVDYDVYSVALRGNDGSTGVAERNGLNDSKHLLLIRANSPGGEYWSTELQAVRSLRGKLRAESQIVSSQEPDFFRAKFDLEPRLQLDDDYVLVPTSEFQGMGAEEMDWSRFERRFPDAAGLITLSRVAYSSDRTEAIVFESHAFGVVGGVGYLVHLRSSGSGWFVVRRQVLWNS